MQTVTIHTTQNIGIDYEIAGLGERILARLLDFAFFFALAIVGGILTASARSSTFGIVFFSAVGILILFYDLICEIAFNGQSAGKRIMNIRVISLTGARPTFSQYFLRWIFRIVDFMITVQLGALITAIASENCQRIGDVVADTTLIRTKPRTKFDTVAFTPPPANYEPVFAMVTELSDEDIALVQEVIRSYIMRGNPVVLYNLAARIKTHLGIATLPPYMSDLQFLQTIIKDHNYLTATIETT